MGKSSYKRLSGSVNLRQRLVLATLSATLVIIENIHSEDTWPGLRSHEVNFLRLLEKICDDCAVEINETGNYCKHCTVSYIFCIYVCCGWKTGEKYVYVGDGVLSIMLCLGRHEIEIQARDSDGREESGA